VNVTVPPDLLFELHVLLSAKTGPDMTMIVNAIAARTRWRIRRKASARFDPAAGFMA
jgi:hypothetical protein